MSCCFCSCFFFTDFHVFIRIYCARSFVNKRILRDYVIQISFFHCLLEFILVIHSNEHQNMPGIASNNDRKSSATQKKKQHFSKIQQVSTFGLQVLFCIHKNAPEEHPYVKESLIKTQKFSQDKWQEYSKEILKLKLLMETMILKHQRYATRIWMTKKLSNQILVNFCYESDNDQNISLIKQYF